MRYCHKDGGVLGLDRVGPDMIMMRPKNDQGHSDSMGNKGGVNDDVLRVIISSLRFGDEDFSTCP